jgi:transposase
MPTHKSGDYKLSAVEYYLTEDKSQQEVCRIFKCSARSLMRWVEKYNKTGEIERHNRKPIAYKINQQEVKYILQELKQNKTITMEDLLVKLKEKFPDFDISTRHLSRVIKDNNITLKITRLRHEPEK